MATYGREKMSKSRIIISDVHGSYKTLLALIAQLPKDIPITFAGDLIDRGLDSRKVVEFVKNGGHDCVRGNHEQMMIDELEFETRADGVEEAYTDLYHGIWEMNGGTICLQSYLVNDGKNSHLVHDVKALREHLEWMKNLPHYLEYKDVKNDKGQHLLVTHSTAAHVWNKYDAKHPEFKASVTWDRDNFPPKIPGIYNVYGHTPRQYKPQIEEHFANIDGGCYMKRGPYGRMYALQFPEMIVYSQDNIESDPS